MTDGTGEGQKMEEGGMARDGDRSVPATHRLQQLLQHPQRRRRPISQPVGQSVGQSIKSCCRRASELARMTGR